MVHRECGWTGFTYRDEDLLVGKDSAFFQVMLSYPRSFDMPAGFHPELKVEMTFEAPRRPPLLRPVSSFVSLGRRSAPEIADVACVDPLEIAADKVSAFLWRARRIIDNARKDCGYPRDGA